MPRKRYSREIESDAETLLVAAVRTARGLCFKLTFLGVAGAPDRIVLLPGGRFYFVELKRPGGRLETSQEIMFPKLQRLGFAVQLLYGVADVLNFIPLLKDNRADPF